MMGDNGDLLNFGNASNNHSSGNERGDEQNNDRRQEDFRPITVQSMNANAQPNNNATTNREVFRVGVKPPTFFKDEPDLYFLQMEAQFRNAGITRDQTKFDHVIAQFDPKYLQTVSDIVRNPPETDKYSALKNRLIKEFTDSDQRKLRRLIKEVELGDDKPSQLLKKMKDLAGGSISDDAIKSLWIERLPEGVRAVVSIADGDSTQWAKQADKMMEMTKFSSVAAVSGTLNDTIEELRKEIASLKMESRGRPSEQSKSNENNKRNRSKSAKKLPFCKFHFRYGALARKCVEPCEFNGKPTPPKTEN